MEEKIFEAIQSLKTEINQKLESLNTKFEGLESRFGGLEAQVKENTDILKALEHSVEVNKAEHDKMGNDIAHISGNVESIKKDLSTMEIVTANNYADLAKIKAVR